MEQTAIFAGGCFWCMVEPFEQRPGIIQVRSGYTGGELENPSYAQVCTNTTGHVEAVQVTFDDTQISYRELVDLYWQTFDPTDVGGQFFDRGSSYAPVIFYADEAQREVAEQSKADLAA
ncbi:MAG TPA: peptide-methionine (S)-S-oxide reductase MsrA, partial [Metalysinibacillus sp.]